MKAVGAAPSEEVEEGEFVSAGPEDPVGAGALAEEEEEVLWDEPLSTSALEGSRVPQWSWIVVLHLD